MVTDYARTLELISSIAHTHTQHERNVKMEATTTVCQKTEAIDKTLILILYSNFDDILVMFFFFAFSNIQIERATNKLIIHNQAIQTDDNHFRFWSSLLPSIRIDFENAGDSF